MNSLWIEQSNKHFKNTSKSLPSQSEICIIGGGLCGLYSALLLAKSGHEVLVLEGAPYIGKGATGLSTGKLTIQHGKALQQLDENVRAAYVTANTTAIQRFMQHLPESLFTERTAYIYSENKNQSEQLKAEYAIYEQLKLPSFATNETELPFAIDLAIALKHQYEIDPYAVQLALAELAIQYGAKIFTQQRVQHIDHASKMIHLQDQRITFKQLVITTHYPIDAIPALQIMKLTNSRSYLCAGPALEPLTSYYISAGQESRTIRSATIGEMHYILYGGTNHAAGVITKNKPYYKIIEEEFSKFFDVKEIPHQWSNQDVQSFDSLPLIGAIHPHIYVATGFRKWGLSQALVGAEIIAAQIDGQKHSFQAFVDPSRVHLLQMLKIAGMTFTQFINGYVNRPTTPKCTHLGCKTRWNEADETWDCPCHGSRFSSNGDVLEGPAAHPLALKHKKNG